MSAFPSRKKVSLALLARTFVVLSLTTYGGAQSAAIRREVVRRHGWIGEDEYVQFRAIAQFSPGPNSTNLAVLIGARLAGIPGAAAAFAAASMPGVAIVVLLGVLVFDPRIPALAGALRGCAAAAVGLSLANAIEMSAPYRGDAVALALAAAVALAVTLLHLPLLPALLLFVPISFALVNRMQRRPTPPPETTTAD